MINDSHLHYGLSAEINKGFSTPEEFLKFKRENNIDHCLLFPFHNISENYQQPHTDIALIHAQDPNVHGLVWVNPDYNEPTNTSSFEDIMDFIDLGFVGVKYHPAYYSKPISDPIFRQLLQNLEAKKAVILLHCGMFKEASIESASSYLHGLIVAAKYPKLKIILGHMGGSMLPIIKKVVEHVADVDNIWLETSGITSPLAVEYAVNHMNPNKILFGSDSPWVSFKAMYHQVNDANIPENIKNRLKYDNLLDLL